MTDQYIATWQTGDEARGQAWDEAWVGPEDEAEVRPGTRPDQAGERGAEAGGYNGGSEAPRRLGPPMSTREVTG